MAIDSKLLTMEEVDQLYQIEENHFYDFKAKEITGKKIGKIISAFANASGGEVLIGIREERDTKIKHWEGFKDIEEANGFLQYIDTIPSVEDYYFAEFLQHPENMTYVLRVTVFKTASILKLPDESIFVRKGAQSLPVEGEEQIKRLQMDKGIISYEDTPLAKSSPSDIVDSEVFETFSSQIIPNTEGEKWLKKQKLILGDHVTVAGILLYSDEPQICLPKRSSIKIVRYRTVGDSDRDTMSEDPITIEGDAYHQIYRAVSAVKQIIESMKRLGHGLESVEYPEETLHEIITNAVLHRDYSIATDIQIRIYDNRVEVESPGKLPGHVTVRNILDAQSARNPIIVRLINKFPNAPNKDIGEGLNTAFAAMEKLRLKPPIIDETDNSVVVIIKHERLASPEEQVIDYLQTHDEITNSIARGITGIQSENTMKRVFWRLRDKGLLEMIPGRPQNKAAWRLTVASVSLCEEQDEQLPLFES